ncbi:hypothetical protein ACGF1Z_09475 [Streptomyces sp. NPDC048018]|uniref:hypothetical protein n=1 Tax=Streptomyces sp. NPDC048018 TaxID=3365499 RepID=UPI00371CE84C
MTTASTPVLRGSGGTVLRQEDDALTLRIGDEETHIPLRAVREVVRDERAVAVELRAPHGAAPVVHRVEGVGEAAAALFVSALGTALAGLPEPDPSLDGAALVTTRSLRTPDGPQATVGAGRQVRGLGWVALSLGPGLAAFLATSVLVVVNGEPEALVVSFLLGLVVIVLNLLSGYTADRALQMALLPRRGITVMAVRTRPYGKSGTYAFTDRDGITHHYFRQAYASEVEVAYHPDDPVTKVGVYPVFVRVLVALSSLVLWAATAGLVWLMILMGRNV